MQKLKNEIITFFSVDKGANGGWIALIQVMAGGYHEVEVI